MAAILSLIIPGLGQVTKGLVSRGVAIFISVAILSGLSIWTAAQRARFPDYLVSSRAYAILLLETGALLLFFLASYSIIKRRIGQQEFTQTLLKALFILLTAAAVGLATEPLALTALRPEERRLIYHLTAVSGAAIVMAIWLWNVRDALVATPKHQPSMTPLTLMVTFAVLLLGTRITEVNLSKAIREYRDTQIILRRIVWPWRHAFEFDVSAVSATALVQAPCPPGETGPPPNQPSEEGPWIIVTPTCGELSTRDTRGNLTLGTKLTIVGGGFVPGETAEIKWRNPIGNEFTPRGVGETEIIVGRDGTFEATIHIPEVTIPAVAEGPQIHTLRVVQTGEAVFTGKLSKDMKLALQGMLETIMMGLVATFAGIVLSIPFSFLAARNLMGSLRSTLQGSSGGLLGMLLGGLLGKQVAGSISAQIGGLQNAPIPTALIHLILILGLAMVAVRIFARSFEWITEHLPNAAARIFTALGMGIIGAGVGYLLGIGFAHGILGITQGAGYAASVAQGYGVVGALVIGLLSALWAARVGSARQVPTGNLVYLGTRTGLNIIRSIEVLIWGLIGVIWVGPGPFAGVLALTVHSVAALGKLYSEAIESISPGPIEALQATGANRLQTIVYAVIPQVLPPFISFTIYRWDINVRMSTVIGLIGGGGIGFLLIQWIRQFQYEAAGIAMWLITITVAALDMISSEIRQRYV
jgi:phosphonate ABC transporter permease subunit PhnE